MTVHFLVCVHKLCSQLLLVHESYTFILILISFSPLHFKHFNNSISGVMKIFFHSILLITLENMICGNISMHFSVETMFKKYRGWNQTLKYTVL